MRRLRVWLNERASFVDYVAVGLVLLVWLLVRLGRL